MPYRFMMFLGQGMILCLFSLSAYASNPPSLRAVRGRLGLIEEVRVMRKLGIRQFQDRHELARLIAAGDLVRVPDRGIGFEIERTIGSRVPCRLRWVYRYLRPQSLRVVEELGREFSMRFRGRSFVLCSLVRSLAYQALLANANATAEQARTTSSHTTGYTFDVLKRGLQGRELRWFRNRLLELEEAGRILATEERGCFHIMVIPTAPPAR